MNTITVVYEIVDKEEWGKTNPLKYEHNGLKAVGVRVGDALAELNKHEGDGYGPVSYFENTHLPDSAGSCRCLSDSELGEAFNKKA